MQEEDREKEEEEEGREKGWRCVNEWSARGKELQIEVGNSYVTLMA